MACYANLMKPCVFPLTPFHCVGCQIESIYPPISEREIVGCSVRNYCFPLSVEYVFTVTSNCKIKRNGGLLPVMLGDSVSTLSCNASAKCKAK